VTALRITPIRQKARPVSDATVEHGAVTRIEGALLAVDVDAGEVLAKRATSCLVAPLLGDRVLVTRGPSGAVYVLAVLEREPSEATTLRVEGDLHIESDGFQLTSKEVAVRASRGSFIVDRLSLLGAKLEAQLATIRVIGDAVESVFERATQTVKRSLRIVEETDQVDVGEASWSAKETMNVHAKNTVVTSEELVKIDGNQIHLG
jgi:hypothetical protein